MPERYERLLRTEGWMYLLRLQQNNTTIYDYWINMWNIRFSKVKKWMKKRAIEKLNEFKEQYGGTVEIEKSG